MTKSQFIKQLTQLISFPTLSTDLEANLLLFDYLKTLIDPQAKIKIIVNGNAAILIASYQDDLDPDIAYLVHSDVVAARDDQFKMRVDDDHLIGRGTSDMKYSIPVGVALLNELIEKKSELSFALVVTSDEEIGGFEGADYLAKKADFRPTAMIVPDGGNNFDFIEKSKGVCQLLIEAKGIPAHASTPWEGENALVKLVKLSSLLLEKFEKNNQKQAWVTTMNISQIEGGKSTNQVCSFASMKLDFRFPETETKEGIRGVVEALAKTIDPKIEISYLSTGLPTKTNTKLAIVKKFIKSFESEIDREVRIQAGFGASDARHFADLKIPILMIKPDGGDIHGDHEWISLAAIMKFYQGLRKFLELTK